MTQNSSELTFSKKSGEPPQTPFLTQFYSVGLQTEAKSGGFSFRKMARNYLLGVGSFWKEDKYYNLQDVNYYMFKDKETGPALTESVFNKQPMQTRNEQLCFQNTSSPNEPVWCDASSTDADSRDTSNLKCIVIDNIPSDTGINSIVSQIRGGPLTKIILESDSANRNQAVKLRLQFLSCQDSNKFMQSAKSHLFQVNGAKLQPFWDDNEQCTDNDVLTYNKNDSEGGVTRCLILKQVVPEKKASSFSRDKNSMLVDLDINEVRRQFSAFGSVQDITPVISRKLCLAIFYLNINSALQAMKSYQTPSSDLHELYSQSWSMWYGKDTTDRPCIQLH
ncbi:Ssp2p KNAG_0A02930 [Huiozyma naganishii CBS 8797]|uniref:RRM domain-containing protein n=1 Tax=Huiozyma naganishii (strain ATCC MYA-139 / BCRC 22969 / CBS 8797 / KCTC 17520 / NBRC 10181 / NCYC 3082 / Yp74L-3) TaxID=1071383 RepID=J7RTF2_HUIN7|nr:hypothetical protein KNAG_0A02930 [Kazachstania naganishii CBS 8797]CCK67982.1 hypothetical protein KNAG_0A02930 [Kazachstania naganishii CBS 8797]